MTGSFVTCVFKMNAYIYNNNLLINIKSNININHYTGNKFFINKDKDLYNDFRQLKNIESIDPDKIATNTKYVIIQID